RARYAGPHPEVIVGGVHHCIHLRLADVPALGFERGFPHSDDHTFIIPPRFCFVGRWKTVRPSVFPLLAKEGGRAINKWSRSNWARTGWSITGDLSECVLRRIV